MSVMRYLFFIFSLLLTTCICAQQKVWMDGNHCHTGDSVQAKRYALVYKKTNKLIKVEEYEKDGTLKDVWHYSTYDKQPSKRKKEGMHKAFYANGKDSLVEMYRENHITGHKMEYHPDGQLHIVSTYHNNMLAGKFLQYYPDGTLRREEYYTDNKCTGGKLFATDGSELPHQPYLVIPEFPGGMPQLLQLISNLIKYPEIAFKRNTEGRVVIQFYIEKDGKMTYPTVIHSVSKEIDAEALRAFEAIAMVYRWTPGYEDGKAIRAVYYAPISFKIP